MARIKIPNVPKSAYDEDRLANDLLLAHVANLERALERKPKRLKGRLTEGQAAQYIRHLSRHLHHRVLLPAMPNVATPIGVALVTAPPRSGRRAGRPARAATPATPALPTKRTKQTKRTKPTSSRRKR